MKLPYYAVIFTSVKTENVEGYNEMAELMESLVKKQDGFLGVESARNDVGITVSYWRDLESIKKWKQNTDHLEAQKKGINSWYKSYTTRIALVEREYSFELADI
ncbi:antibiotic biosynthesis monooxygenase family protein [Flavobacterium sp.]|uniref:antibiotic biosynthesis monooxygenase family protein n=1 Tax=Flavobacterium sp. TaxID=239 RepID=UPI0038FC7B06